MLADEIAEGRFIVSRTLTGEQKKMIEYCIEIAKEAIVCRIDNVEEYVRLRYSRGKEPIKSEDLPCIAPPFEKFILESRGCGEVLPWAMLSVGHEFDDRDMFLTDDFNNRKPRWDIESVIFSMAEDETQAGRRWLLPILGSEIFLDKNGAFITELRFDLTATDENSRIGESGLGIGLFAISFMHCKNVVQRSIKPPPKLSKRHRERHGRPLFSYRVLEIEPMKQVFRTEGRSDEVGLARALHICRGHFKDYRERGLFGRNKGLYWWDHHVRGSAAAGVAAKDYSVKVPA